MGLFITMGLPLTKIINGSILIWLKGVGLCPELDAKFQELSEIGFRSDEALRS